MSERIHLFEIDKILKILRNNGTVALPTDTVYGLAIKSDSKENYDKLVKIKNRPETKPFPLMVSSYAQIEKIADVSDLEKAMIDKFMPGKITIVLNKKEDVFDYLNSDTIAIRMSDDWFLKEIIDALNVPIWLPSANKSNMKTASHYNDVIEQLDNEIDGIVLEEELNGTASTIVRFTDNGFEVLREGPISHEELEKEVRKYLENK